MECYGDISTNCRTIHINSYIEKSLKNFILTGIGTEGPVLFALNEIQLSGLFLTTGPRLQE
jgi:hypothetical protein